MAKGHEDAESIKKGGIAAPNKFIFFIKEKKAPPIKTNKPRIIKTGNECSSSPPEPWE